MCSASFPNSPAELQKSDTNASNAVKIAAEVARKRRQRCAYLHEKAPTEMAGAVSFPNASRC